MRKVIALALCCLMVMSMVDCAGLRHNMRRHPVIWGVAIGAVAGTTIALATRHNCPKEVFYDGKWYPYDGTPPCPGPNYNPTAPPALKH